MFHHTALPSQTHKMPVGNNLQTTGRMAGIFGNFRFPHWNKFLSMNGVGNGAVVISEKQTKARGRSGKNWESPLGGVWLSIILNPNVTHSKIPLITLATGVAVENTLKRIGIENAEIKWPNDILIQDKKVCGIPCTHTGRRHCSRSGR